MLMLSFSAVVRSVDAGSCWRDGCMCMLYRCWFGELRNKNTRYLSMTVLEVVGQHLP
jgi:hypothetical protein